MSLKRKFFGGVILLLGLSVTIFPAGATKPPSGSSTGTGRVFFPNPVASLQNQSLTDQNDADYAALQPAYRIVTLTNLNGSGYLRGDWANVIAETGNPAYSATNTFVYGRTDDRFEQVMAYYWVTEAQKYIQSLGFGSTRRPVNKEPQDLRLNQSGADNSYSWDKHDVMRFGKGGVDDAEDAEVILHEYGHAIQDSQQTPSVVMELLKKRVRLVKALATIGRLPSRQLSRQHLIRLASLTGIRFLIPAKHPIVCAALTLT